MMPTMNQPQPPKTSFKKEYIRILLHGPSGPKDFGFARELMDQGYAEGRYQTSRGRDDYGKVKELIWQGINAQGRLFADRLSDEVYRASWRARAVSLAQWAGGVAVGVAVEMWRHSWICG
jgi:hypothetical protein